MIVEVIRLLADALAHEGYGVNAKIQSLDIYSDHDRPRAIRRVLDITRNDEVMTGNLGIDWPLLIVPNAAEVVLEGEITTTKRDTGSGEGVRAWVAYMSEASRMETRAGMMEALYTLRAVQQTVGEWLDNANILDRQSHNVTVRDCLSMRVAPGVALLETSELVVGGAIQLDLECRDLNP